MTIQLTTYTDYALRALLYVGSLPDGERTQVKDIASVYNISLNHLQKVIHDLGRKGVLHTIRGKHGGIALAHKPVDINIGKLVRELKDVQLVECFRDNNNCLISNSCKLKEALAKAQHAFFQVLDQYSLADFLENKADLYALFKIAGHEEPLTP